MIRVGLLACYGGLLTSLAAPNFSLALSLRSTRAVSQESRAGSTLFLSIEQTAPTADDKTDGEP